MIGMGTLTNVAAGSGLKILGYVAGRLVDGYFENKRHTIDAIRQKTDDIIRTNSGVDTANEFTSWTRRILAWMFGFTACFVITIFALDASTAVPMLTDREHGIFGWVFGGANQETVTVTKAQMIMGMWSLLEVLFGFYFTKLGGKS